LAPGGPVGLKAGGGHYSLWWGASVLAKRITLGGNSTTEEEAAVLRETFFNTNPELMDLEKNYTQYTSMKPHYYIEISI
jgi:hypothetical protein